MVALNRFPFHDDACNCPALSSASVHNARGVGNDHAMTRQRAHTSIWVRYLWNQRCGACVCVTAQCADIVSMPPSLAQGWRTHLCIRGLSGKPQWGWPMKIWVNLFNNAKHHHAAAVSSHHKQKRIKASNFNIHSEILSSGILLCSRADRQAATSCFRCEQNQKFTCYHRKVMNIWIFTSKL